MFFWMTERNRRLLSIETAASVAKALSSASSLGGELAAALLVEYVHDADDAPEMVLHRGGEDRLRSVAGELVDSW